MRTALPKALNIQGLSKTYRMPGGKPVPAVENFNLDLTPGEFVTLLGPSGCGKTTVLRTLAGLEDLDGGEILLDGRSIARQPAHQRGIGLVFQNYALFPHMSVFENVAYSLRLRKIAKATLTADVNAALEAVGLGELGPRLPGQLSGGQQQRVAVARALVMKPDLLLFDEPLSNLDAKLRVQVRAELRRLQKSLGTTALYVTHDQDEAMSLSDRIAVMRAGKVEQVAPPHEIYERPATLFVAEFVGKVNALAGRITQDNGAAVTIEVMGQALQVDRGLATSSDILALVRPEAVRIGPQKADGLNGRVEELEYLGDQTEYRIRVGPNLVTAVQSTLGQSRQFAEGDTISLELIAEAIHLLPADAHRLAA
ncbi:MAG TPA: ABC transporter ATP-binding protein [Burkholderiaceae bacterium]|nr:ABC transporter ATP-binding protein [Burkholderiaceae bacterium]